MRRKPPARHALAPRFQLHELGVADLPRLWTIDRRERIEGLYSVAAGKLQLDEAKIEVRDWPAEEIEPADLRHRAALENGGCLLGVLCGRKLAAAGLLDGRRLGARGVWRQLLFLHVSHDFRRMGLGGYLLEELRARAADSGASGLYISATPSRSTVDFYRRYGVRPVARPVPRLLALEPDDIHLVMDCRSWAE